MGTEGLTRLDHLTVVAPTLDAGVAYVESSLGVAPGPGRIHPDMGTHNRLLSLGRDSYLEVIAVDPRAAPVDRPRWFGLDALPADASPRLAAWVASTDAIEQATEAEFGRIESMWRATHAWRMTVRPDGQPPFGGAVPLLIQRDTPASPAATMPPSGLQLKRLRIHHPDPMSVERILTRIGMGRDAVCSVQACDRVRLVAEIETPTGLRTLGSAEHGAWPRRPG